MIKSGNTFLVILAILIALTSCKSNYNVVRVDLNKKADKKSGFYYYLPKNYLKINISIEKQDNIKGPYSEYAKQYFGLTNVLNSNSTTYSIKNISVENLTEIDTSNVYFVETNNANLKVNFNEDGYISDINYMDINNIKKNTDLNESKSNLINQSEYPIIFKKFADLNMYEKVDTFYKKVKLDTSFIIEKTFKTSLVEKPIELKVKEIADYISKIKEAKFNIITGEVDGVDKKNLEFMYQELQNQEEQYLTLFTGISIKNTTTYSFYYFPEKDTNRAITNQVLCKFSPSRGIYSEDESDLNQISIQLNTEKNLTNLQKFNDAKLRLNISKHGFYYRNPAIVKLAILHNNNVIYNDIIKIAQLGFVLSLPNKKLTLTLDEKTGSIKLLKLN